MTSTTDTIDVHLEDGPRSLPAGSTVADLMTLLDLAPLRTTVAVDGRHVPRAQWVSHPLQHGQQVLFFRPIVGG